jgi:RNA polymerase sigma-70 factor (ECF subfamily)
MKLDLAILGQWFSRSPSGRALPRSEEDELIDGLRRGDPSAIDRAYRLHHGALRAFAQRLVGEQAAAEDLVHDVFVALPGALRSFRGDSALRTFMIGIAAQRSRRHVRSAARRRALVERVRAEVDPEPLVADHAVRSEQGRALARALDQLPDAQRMAFVLCEVEQRSAAEAALILEIPEATVRTRCFHARQKLRELLREVAP